MKIKNILFTMLCVLIPSLSFAVGKTLQDLVHMAIGYLNIFLILLMAFAFVVVILNIVKFYVINTEGDRKEAHMYVLYSVIGFFIILSFWGVVNIVINTFNLDSSAPSSWSQVQNIFPGSNSYKANQSNQPNQINQSNPQDKLAPAGQITEPSAQNQVSEPQNSPSPSTKFVQ